MKVTNQPLPTVSIEQPKVAPKKSEAPEPIQTAAKEPMPERTVEPQEAQNTAKTSVYLKVVSRLENMLEGGALPEKAVEGFSKAVETRLSEMDAKEKKIVLLLPETQALKLDNINDLPRVISQGLGNKEQAKQILALLKQPKFAEFMGKKLENQGNTYSPQEVAANTQKAKEAQSAKPAGADKTVPVAPPPSTDSAVTREVENVATPAVAAA